MNAKTWIPLLVAIVLGIVAAYFATNMTAPSQTKGPASGPQVQVASAVRTLAPGDEIRPDDIVLMSISAGQAPQGTFSNTDNVVGRVVMLPMVQGQPVLEGCLAPTGAGGGIQALVPAGMRAISIEVSEFSGLSGMLMPGSFVDVISTIHAADQDIVARTIVQNVQVKAVGQRINAGEKEDDAQPMSRAVTLLVTPQQAEKLELAVVTMRSAGAGLPWLVLRAPLDKEEKGTLGVTVADLRGESRSNDRDVYETRPVMQTTTTPPANLSQLNQDSNVAHQGFTSAQREVTIIRGGVESKVIVKASVDRNSMLSNSETDYINK
ncbi:MAG: Flp pilus assembly protein CpaB [Phycisphaerales bacterium]|nr:Flp pilus assembly protein CpaB [Phycisphaerales bacterium]